MPVTSLDKYRVDNLFTTNSNVMTIEIVGYTSREFYGFPRGKAVYCQVVITDSVMIELTKQQILDLHKSGAEVTFAQ